MSVFGDSAYDHTDGRAPVRLGCLDTGCPHKDENERLRTENERLRAELQQIRDDYRDYARSMAIGLEHRVADARTDGGR